MRTLCALALIAIHSVAHSQFREEQVELLARLNCELSNAWTISDLHEQDFLFGGRTASSYSADLFTPKTSRKGNNEGVSLYFFEKAVADSVEAYFAPDEVSSTEFIYTKSFIVVISYFTSNGKFYDIYTRSMLKELRNYFSNWHSAY